MSLRARVKKHITQFGFEFLKEEYPRVVGMEDIFFLVTMYIYRETQ